MVKNPFHGAKDYPGGNDVRAVLGFTLVVGDGDQHIPVFNDPSHGFFFPDLDDVKPAAMDRSNCFNVKRESVFLGGSAPWSHPFV